MMQKIRITLDDELQSFVARNCGAGKLYATPADFIRKLLFDRKQALESESVREAVLEGYQDAIAGRLVVYRGNLRELLQRSR